MIRGRYLLVAVVLFIVCETVSAAPPVDESRTTEGDSVEADLPAPTRLPSLVITEEDIRRSGAVVLGEILNWLPGLEVLDRGYLGSGKTASLEGFPADHLLVLIDGEVVNDIYGGSFDLNMIPLSAVEKVEFTRRASLLDRDTRAPGGAIHIQTKKHDGGSAFTRLALGGGSFDTNYQEGLFRRGLFDQQVGLSIAFDRVSTDGFEMEEDYKAFQYLFRVDEFRWDWIDLSFSASGTKSSGESTESEDTTSTDVEKEFRHLNVRAAFNANGSLPLEVSAYFTKNREDSLVRVNSAATSKRRGDRKGIRFTGLLRHVRGWVIEFGAGEDFNSLNGDEENRTFSLFTGATCEVEQWPMVEFMARWEREGSRYSEWSGGMTSSYSLNRMISIFASIIDSRHLPLFAERLNTGWPDPPRKERVVDGGFTVETPNFQGSVTGFRRWSQPVGPDADSSPGSDSQSEYRLGVSGVRIEMGTELGRHLDFTAGYQGARADDVPSGIVGLPVPKHHITGRIELKGNLKNDKIGLACNLSANLVKGRSQAVPANSSGDDDYGYVDLNARFRLVDVTFFYTIRNGFDADFEVVEGFPMPGRVSRFGFRWDFFD
jgi:outer membrane receptor for ferrienterochelin and colicins